MDKEKKYDLYYNLLVSWNKRINLTTIVEKEKAEVLHFKDSLAGEEFIENGAKLLDVGSGAGFPGIPLKIEREDLDVTLIDCVGKKVNFLNEVISKLELKNIKAVHSRIEDFKEKNFDVVVSRAVAPLNVLTEYCLPFVKVKGKMIAYKGQRKESEEGEAERAIELLGGKKANIVEINMGEYKRTLYIIEKIKETPIGYPRGGNKPRIKPII